MRLLIGIVFALAIGVHAQQPTANSVKLPAERGTQLQQLIAQQDKLKQEFNALEAQKVIVIQRAALELGLDAKQVDQMDVVMEQGMFVFRPKPQPSPKKE